MSVIFKEILAIDGVLFSLLILIYFFRNRIPMNGIVGYKTNRAFKSDKHWRFAQNYAFSKLLILLPIQVVTHLLMYVFIENWILYSNMIIGVTFANICLVFILVIYFTEKKLSKLE